MTGDPKYQLDRDTVLSSENTFERFATAREQATRESNRYFVGSLIFLGLYLIRASGLRVDVTLFNAKVLEIPYGLFFFLLASQVSLCISFLRLTDACGYGRRMLDMAQEYTTDDPRELISLFPNQYEWFGTTELPKKVRGMPISKGIFYFSGLLTAVFALALMASPVAAGLFFLVNANHQIGSGNADLQYWTVFGSTIFAALWFCNYVAVYRLSTYTGAAE